VLLTGGRVKVEPQQGAMRNDGSRMLTSPANFDRVSQSQRFVERGFTRLVVGVLVRNVGRLPVTVERWSLIACSRERGGSGGLWGIETVRELLELTPIAVGSIGPPLAHQLEAGASEIWVADGEQVRKFADDAKSTFDVSTVWIMAKVGLGDGRSFRTADGIQF
jgi:hypothetical protein